MAQTEAGEGIAAFNIHDEPTTRADPRWEDIDAITCRERLPRMAPHELVEEVSAITAPFDMRPIIEAAEKSSREARIESARFDVPNAGGKRRRPPLPRSRGKTAATDRHNPG